MQFHTAADTESTEMGQIFAQWEKAATAAAKNHKF